MKRIMFFTFACSGVGVNNNPESKMKKKRLD
jgi:hypothetical protein